MRELERDWRRWLPIVALVGLGCIPGGARQTALMEAIPGVDMSTMELKLRVRDFQDYFAATVEEASQQIVEAEVNRLYKVNSLLWRTNSIAAVQRHECIAARTHVVAL